MCSNDWPDVPSVQRGIRFSGSRGRPEIFFVVAHVGLHSVQFWQHTLTDLSPNVPKKGTRWPVNKKKNRSLPSDEKVSGSESVGCFALKRIYVKVSLFFQGIPSQALATFPLKLCIVQAGMQ